MNRKLWNQAQKLASRPYTITIEKVQMSEDEVVYLAHYPDLPGCKAVGDSMVEAEANLAEARIDYIYALLEMGLDVPFRMVNSTASTVRPVPLYSFDVSQSKRDQEQSSIDAVPPEQKGDTLTSSLAGDLARHRQKASK